MSTISQTTATTNLSAIQEYYSQATADYKFWSKAMHMHFGFYHKGMSPFNLEKMLIAMTHKVFESFGIERYESITGIDLGCGVGASTREFVRYFPQSSIIGVSIVESQIKLATKMSAKDVSIDFLCSDYTNVPLANSSMDVAFAIESSCHAEGADKGAFLEESFRLLKSGGKLVVADGFLKHNKSLPAYLDKIYKKTCTCWALPQMGELEAFTNKMKKLGFTNIQVEDVSWHVAPSVAFVPLITLKFLWKYARHWKTLSPERKNNIFAPLLTMILGLARKHFSYYIISATKL